MLLFFLFRKHLDPYLKYLFQMWGYFFCLLAEMKFKDDIVHHDAGDVLTVLICQKWCVQVNTATVHPDTDSNDYKVLDPQTLPKHKHICGHLNQQTILCLLWLSGSWDGGLVFTQTTLKHQ